MDKNYAEGIEKLLDELLTELKAYPIYFDKQMEGFVLQKHYMDKFGLSDTDIIEIIDYLQIDGYVRPLTTQLENSRAVNIQQVSISLRGKEFLNKGGYTKLAIDISRETAMHDRNENLLSTYTIVLAFGTLGLVVVEALIHRYALRSLFCCCH